MNNELLYQIALTKVPNIGDVRAKSLIQIFGDASVVFKSSKTQLEKIDGMGTVAAASIKTFADFTECESEILFIEKYKIKPLFINDENYPKRLLGCYDSPVLLYFKGNADLNAEKIVSIVGTRTNSDYGKQVCEQLVKDLSSQQVLIMSGLAHGVDTIAHKNSLKNNMPTVAVLAHGLDRIYPLQNKTLAKEITGNGGLLTDFCSNTNPDKQNFPKRNRIVAGICDALIVIESGLKGGSLITAELANGYNKDVFAIPGRSIDKKSEGCNYLIKNNKASLIQHAEDLVQMMNWAKRPKPISNQKKLFVELSPDEKKLTALLEAKENCHIDELFLQSGLSASTMAATLLQLEMQGLILSLPGKIYKLS
jgi:DNA processing protein